MGGGARVSRLAFALAWIALSAACRGSAPDAREQTTNVASPVAPQVTPAPADHLAPGELLEGSQTAFGVALPRALEVRRSFVNVIYAGGPVSVHSLAEYFRARLEAGVLREGPSAATFDHVKARGKGGPELLVRISSTPQGASVEIRDQTPPPAPVLPDERSRWKQVGLTPQGRLADPTHLD
jgi:hypothetical protein